MPRLDGNQAKNTFVSNKICKEKIPQLLIDFYNTRIIWRGDK